MKTETLTPIAESFANALAAQYDLPEVRYAKFQVQQETVSVLSLTSGRIPIGPRGQLACIVKDLSVQIDVHATQDGKWISGVINYSYSHHSGGSNGSDHRFVIVTESRYAKSPTYAGMLDEALCRQNENNHARD